MNTSTRKHLLVGFLALFISASAIARFNLWEPENGVEIRQGHHINFVGEGMATDGEGNWCIAWADAHTGSQDVYAQLYDSEGNELWAQGGVTVANGSWAEQLPMVVYGGDDEWIIGWYDYRNDEILANRSELYLQRLSSQGARLWDEEGIHIADMETIQADIKIFPTSDGGIIATWSFWRNRCEIAAQRLNTEGERLWTDSGVIAADSASWHYSVSVNEDDELLVLWGDAYASERIYLQKLDEAGDQTFGEGDGILISEMDIDYLGDLAVASDGSGGAFVVWTDDSDDYIHGQHVNAQGEFQWDEDDAVIAEPQRRGEHDTKILASNPGEGIVVWDAYDEIGRTNSVYTQRITTVDRSPLLHWGAPGAEVEGLVVSPDGSDAEVNGIVSDGAGGAIAYFRLNHQVYPGEGRAYSMQRVSIDGSTPWGVARIMELDQQYPCPNAHAVLLLEDRVLYVWRDLRAELGGLYYQVCSLEDGTQRYEDEGIAIVEGLHFNTRKSRIIRSGESVYTAWVDYRYSYLGSVPFLQKVDFATGEPQWDGQGISLLTDIPFDAFYYPALHVDSLKIVEDGFGGVIAVWQQYFRGNTHVYAQRVDENGNLLWGDNGVRVGPEDVGEHGEVIDPRPVATEDGGVIIFYHVRSSIDGWYADLMMNRLDEDGIPVWEDENGIQLDDLDYGMDIEEVVQLDDGSIFICFSHSTRSWETDIYGALADVNGEILWDEPLLIFDVDNSQMQEIHATKVGDNLIVAYSCHDQETGFHPINIQRISLEGELLYDDGGIEILSENPGYGQFELESGGDDSFWIAWELYLPDNQYSELFYMLFDIDGEEQLEPESGVKVGEVTGRYLNPKLVSDDADGFYMFWKLGEVNEVRDFFYTHIDRNGLPAHDDYDRYGAILTDAYNAQNELTIVPDGEHGVLAAWTDYRGSMVAEHEDDVYIMRVNDMTIMGTGKGENVNTPLTWKLDAAYPNPFNPSTTIAFTVPGASVMHLTVFDLLGREVARLVDGRMNAGEHSVVWDGHDASGIPVASGMYFYRLESEDVNIARKMILMK